MVALVRPAAKMGGTELLVAVPIENPARNEAFEASDGIGTTTYHGTLPHNTYSGVANSLCLTTNA